jgi:hemolysin activation/secretion protein
MKKQLLWFVALFLSISVDLHAQEEGVPSFEIKRYLAEGNTILPSEKVATLLVAGTGKERDFGDIQQTIERLEEAYRSRGYKMVTVILPEQEMASGEVRLQVIEPRITQINIDGNKHFTRENILDSIPTLKTGESPRVDAISENLRAANENPARKITLQFKPQDNPEELHAALQVTDQKPWKFTLSGDNTGSGTTGDYRTGLGFQYFNLFNLDHVASLQYTTSPDHFKAVKIVSGSYRIPFYKLGDTLDIFGAYSDVDSGTSRTAIAGVDAKTSGKGIVSGFRYNMNMSRFGDYEQKLTGGMDYRLYDNSAFYIGSALDPNENQAKNVVAHPLSLTYGGVWTTEPLVIDGSLGLLYNIPWGSLGGKADFAAARSGAPADYLIVRYGLNFMIRPGADWMVRIAGTGQYTPDRLIPGEQFGYGGSAVLRGYAEREESWDAGFSGSFEVYSPDIAQLMDFKSGQFRLLAFFDGGTGYNLRPQPTDPPITRNSLKSTGAGFRFGIGETFSFTMDWGYALDNSSLVASPTTSPTKRGGSAFHFKGQLSY